MMNNYWLLRLKRLNQTESKGKRTLIAADCHTRNSMKNFAVRYVKLLFSHFNWFLLAISWKTDTKMTSFGQYFFSFLT